MSSCKANILLVNPWIVDFAAYDFWMKPIGLLTIANVLRQNNYQVTLVDCLDRNNIYLQNFLRNKKISYKNNGTGHYFKQHIAKPDIVKWVQRYYSRYGLPYTIVSKQLKNLKSPDVILVTSSMTYWYPGVVQIIDLLKRIFPKVHIVLGGIYATLCPEHADRISGADYVVKGEGEISALKIVDELTGNTSPYNQYQCLDDYPAPAYDLYNSLDSVALLSSRGCPFNCPLCASNLLYGKYRRRSISKIIKEIIFLHKHYQVKEFAFYDDALLYKKQEHIIPLLKEIVNNNLNIHFHTPNGIQPREVDSTVASLMKAAGFRTINLSYESIDKNRQKELCSKVTDDDLRYAVNNLVNSGFKPQNLSAYVLMGLPEQRIQEVIESIHFVYSLGIKVSLASFSPIPGTQYWYKAIQTGKLSQDTDPILTNNSIFPLNRDKYKHFIGLRKLSATGNQLLTQSKNPLRESSYADQLSKISE